MKNVSFITDIPLDPQHFWKEESCQQDSGGWKISDMKFPAK